MTETHRVRDLAELVAKLWCQAAMVPNPRKESAENRLHVSNNTFLELGLEPTTLSEGLLHEVEEVAQHTPTEWTAPRSGPVPVDQAAACGRSGRTPRQRPLTKQFTEASCA